MRLPVLRGTRQVECELDKDSHLYQALPFCCSFLFRISHDVLPPFLSLIQEQVGCDCCHSGASGARGWVTCSYPHLLGMIVLVVSGNCMQLLVGCKI